MRLFVVVMATVIWLAAACPTAQAGLVLDHVVLDFEPGSALRDDIDVLNDGSERIYVVVEPAEIVAPGLAAEHRVASHDPKQLGLLVSPARFILEPGQRKFVRVATLAANGERDRIYRVTIKPVVGALSSKSTGVKILVGYDVLVILRPTHPAALVTATRVGRTMIFTNSGNTNAELFNGRQCDASGGACSVLPATRLYAGASWRLPLSRDTPVEFSLKIGDAITTQSYR